MGTIRLRFPSEDAARRFVRYLAKTVVDVACMRSGDEVWVVDGTHLHARDVMHAAFTFGGRAS